MTQKLFSVWRTRGPHVHDPIPDDAWEEKPYSRHNTLEAAQNALRRLLEQRRSRCGLGVWDENYGITDAEGYWVENPRADAKERQFWAEEEKINGTKPWALLFV